VSCKDEESHKRYPKRPHAGKDQGSECWNTASSMRVVAGTASKTTGLPGSRRTMDAHGQGRESSVTEGGDRLWIEERLRCNRCR